MLDDAWTKVSRRGGDPGTFDGGVGGGQLGSIL